ncbi:hypothetical protein C5C69_06600 [Rathayibacter sp. AY1C7]|uniref:ParB family protein n=1 Tax=Rathayibacter sp. AY1C7 TaxID=2080540 RepID=UPI000CE89244|nr:hypothetical protein [Rathayibacter sp. AY1C7]PPG61978.1 hypothetical protein C5C69_06600 [Rathayibacter sp. AY1C7]
MNRPAPRKSSLAGANPITPPQIAAAEPAAEPPAPQDSPARAAPPAPAIEQQETLAAKPTTKPTTKPKYPPKVSFYQDPVDTSRVRGAIRHTQVQEGTRTLSQFINDAVMEKVARLEAQYNGGQPFASVGARELPQGRPMGE